MGESDTGRMKGHMDRRGFLRAIGIATTMAAVPGVVSAHTPRLAVPEVPQLDKARETPRLHGHLRMSGLTAYVGHESALIVDRDGSLEIYNSRFILARDATLPAIVCHGMVRDDLYGYITVLYGGNLYCHHCLFVAEADAPLWGIDASVMDKSVFLR